MSWNAQFTRANISLRDRLDGLKTSVLHLFDVLLSCSHQSLSDPRLVRPLFQVLSSCLGLSVLEQMEGQLVQVLHQLCIAVTKNPSILELLFTDTPGRPPPLSLSASNPPLSVSAGQSDASPAESLSNQFVMFSLLVPFVHRDGVVAQQARDDLLLIMALLSAQDRVSQHIVNSSDFCPVSTS